MDNSPLPPLLTPRKTYRVKGPRPFSWISPSPDSSLNGHRDTWPWSVQRSKLSRGSTLRSTSSSESSYSGFSSSSSSPVHTPNTVTEFGEQPYSRHSSRRKPTGPRAPRDSSCFDVRPRLAINTSLPAAPQLRREISPITPVEIADILQSPHMPHIAPLDVHSPTNFPLDWDAIFEILGCSESPQMVQEVDS